MGGNTITTVVTAEDSASTMTYVVTVVRAPSSNAGLAGLASNVGLLSPGFSDTTTAYTINVAHPVATMTLTPSVADSGASVTVTPSMPMSKIPWPRAPACANERPLSSPCATVDAALNGWCPRA